MDEACGDWYVRLVKIVMNRTTAGMGSSSAAVSGGSSSGFD